MPSIIINEEILAKAMEFRPGPYWEMPSVGDFIYMEEFDLGPDLGGECWFFKEKSGKINGLLPLGSMPFSPHTQFTDWLKKHYPEAFI